MRHFGPRCICIPSTTLNENGKDGSGVKEGGGGGGGGGGSQVKEIIYISIYR